MIAVVALAALGFGYWTISPFFIDKKVSESFPVIEQHNELVTLSTGSFEGFDRIHYGSGDVSLIETDEGYLLWFDENFNVANGPDLVVGLGRDGEYKKETQIDKLKGNIGSQYYFVPKEINIEEYNEVWIWCRAFSVGFAKAKLNPLNY